MRFFSALVATILSIWAFYVGDPMIFMWWFTVHNLMVMEMLKIVGSFNCSCCVSFVLSQVLFFEFGLKLFDMRVEILAMLMFIPFMIAVLDPWRDFKGTMVVTMSCIWITYPCSIGYRLSSNPSFIVGFLCIVWFTDAGAYFCGKFFGRTPLLQSISPKKSVEGTIGGITISILVGFIVSNFVTNLSRSEWLYISIIASVTGQIGDLFESLFKRYFVIKDSGDIMPGHGGMLDRFDAVLFALIFVQAYLVW